MLISISVAKFIVPDWGDKVDSGIGLSYLPTRLHRLAGRYTTPYAGVKYSPYSGTMNLATGYLIPQLYGLYVCDKYMFRNRLQFRLYFLTYQIDYKMSVHGIT